MLHHLTFSNLFIWLHQVLAVAHGTWLRHGGLLPGMDSLAVVYGLQYLQHRGSLVVAHALWSSFLAPITVGNLIFIYSMYKKHLPRHGSIGFTPVPMQSTQCL